MTPTGRQRLRSIAAAITLLVLLVGVPILLVGIARWPLPTTIPDWDGVRVAIIQGDLPADVVVRGLAVVVWIVWAQLAWATVWELAVNLPRTGRGERSRPGPLVAPVVGAGVARLVALLFSVTAMTTTAPATALAAALTPAPVVVQHASTDDQELAAPDDAVQPASELTWTVASGDSLWRIAETALGDGSRATEIFDLNPFLRSPRDVHPGQALRLPADAEIPADRRPSPRPSPVAGAYVPATEIVVVPGDNLWNLATAHLAASQERAPTQGEIRSYLDRVLETNVDAVGDPNLIHPGDVFTFPAIGTAPTAQPPDDQVDDERDDEAPPLAPVADLPDETSTTTPATSITDPPPAPAMSTAPRPVAPSPPSTAPSAATPSLAQQARSLDHLPQPPSVAGSDSSVPAIAGVTGALVLATGLLLAHRRHRSRLATAGASALRRRPGDTELEAALVAAADIPLLQWANHEMAEAFAQLDPSCTAAPVAVEISESHGIEILWDQPNPHPPRPWEATDGGWAWRILYDPDHELPSAPTASPIPGLVTLGTRNGRQLVVDLEAFPAITIAGPTVASEDLLRSMLTELAASEIVADSYVHIVDLDGLGVEPFSRVRMYDIATASEHLRATVESHQHLLETSGIADTFQLRRMDAAGRELVVVAVQSEALDEIPTRSLPPRHGVAVVALGHHPEVAATITIDNTGHARLEPLGIDFTPAALTTATEDRIERLLSEAPPENDHDLLDAQEEVGCDSADVPSAHAPSSNGHHPPVDDEPYDDTEPEQEAPAQPAFMVRVLGPPDVPAFPSLGRLETSLVAFLACSGGSATIDQVIDAVWNGRLVERTTVWNRLSKARSVLGHLLPQREQGSNQVSIHPDLGSDLDHLRHVVDHAEGASTAEAIDLLVEGLELVRGVPFDAPGYDWAHQHQHHARACELVESAGLRLAEIALEVGDLSTARHGVAQALRALPANEPLYRMRMRIEAAADNPVGVRSAYDELVASLDDWGDGQAADPSPTTRRLRDQLTASVRT